MADKKISSLTSASTPLAGTEVLPIVQSSSTVKVSVANLTAGRDMAATSITVGSGRTKLASTYVADVPGPTGNNTGILFGGNTIFPCDGNGALTNGVASLGNSSYQWNDIFLANNVIIKTAAKGVNFTANTPAAGMTSQLLNWYEEGTFTPSLVPGTSGSITLTTAAAKYTRIGRAVTVTGICEVSSVSSPVGALLLQGLPFTNSADASSRSAAAIYATGLAVTATTSIVGRIIPSESQIRIEKFSAGSTSAMAGDVQTNTIIQFCLTYFV